MEQNRITVDLEHAYPFSPFVFGHNPEHTRGSVTVSLTAPKGDPPCGAVRLRVRINQA